MKMVSADGQVTVDVHPSQVANMEVAGYSAAKTTVKTVKKKVKKQEPTNGN